MSDSLPRGQLLNQDLEFNNTLERLWQVSHPFSVLSPLAKKRLLTSANVIIRSYDKAAFDNFGEPDLSPITLAQLSETHPRHISKLKQLGINVVSHRVELDTYLDATSLIIPREGILGYAGTKYIPNSVILSSDKAKTILDPRMVGQKVITPYRRYLEWCNDAGEGIVFDDFFRPSQQSVHLPSQTIFLHDIDPYAIEATPDNLSVIERDLMCDFEEAGYKYN